MSTERSFIVGTTHGCYMCVGKDFFAALSAYRAAYPNSPCWNEVITEVIEI